MRLKQVRAPVALAGLAFAACAGRATPAARTASRVETFSTTMPQLEGRARTIRVYLPKGYTGSDRRYPVLYMQDGQQLFSPGPYGDWRVDEVLDSLSDARLLDGLIVVGVDNGPRRWAEYGPWRNARMFDWVDATWSAAEEGGDGARYVEFLAATLKPEIDRRYRTRPQREFTGIGGSSMGGLIALHAGITRPDVFSKVMAMSTAVWFAEGGSPWLSDNRLVRSLEGRPLPRDLRIWMDIGTEERSRATDPGVSDAQGARVSYPRAYLEGSRAVARALVAGGVPAAHLRHVEDAGAPHHESAWSRRLGDALQWLYE